MGALCCNNGEVVSCV